MKRFWSSVLPRSLWIKALLISMVLGVTFMDHMVQLDKVTFVSLVTNESDTSDLDLFAFSIGHDLYRTHN